MTIRNTLKTAAISLVLVVGTAGSAFAGVAWADGDSKVKDEPKKWADTIDWLYDGEKVHVDWCGKYYCFIEHKGPDGYVRKSDLNFKKWDDDDHDVDVEICLGGGGFGGGGFGFGEICIGN